MKVKDITRLAEVRKAYFERYGWYDPRVIEVDILANIAKGVNPQNKTMDLSYYSRNVSSLQLTVPSPRLNRGLKDHCSPV